MLLTGNCAVCLLTSTMAVITRLTRDASNVLTTVILSTTWCTDSETDAHCGNIVISLICDNNNNCRDAAWPRDGTRQIFVTRPDR